MTTVTTDQVGHLPADVTLEPNTTYMIWCEDTPPVVSHFQSIGHLIQWIDSCVLGDLRTLREGIKCRESSASQSDHLGGGNFLLAAGCCMALEYFGQIYGKGSDATACAQAYAEEFLEPIDKRYTEFFWLFWTCFRNGIIHGSWPQAICIQGDDQNWLSIGANNSIDGDHLGPASGIQTDTFVISSVRFLQDLERSFVEGFKGWLLQQESNEVLDRANPRLLKIKRGNEEGKKQFHCAKALNQKEPA